MTWSILGRYSKCWCSKICQGCFSLLYCQPKGRSQTRQGCDFRIARIVSWSNVSNMKSCCRIAASAFTIIKLDRHAHASTFKNIVEPSSWHGPKTISGILLAGKKHHLTILQDILHTMPCRCTVEVSKKQGGLQPLNGTMQRSGSVLFP